MFMQLKTRVHLEMEKEGNQYSYSMPFGAPLSDSVAVLADMHNQLIGLIKQKQKEAEEQKESIDTGDVQSK